MTLVLIAAAMAAAGILGAFIALALPKAGTDEKENTASWSSRVREKINQPFQVLAERSSQQRRLNGGLTLPENLARADIKLRSSEFVMIELAVMIVAAVITLWRFGFGWQFVIAGLIGYLLPMRYVKYRQRKRLRELDARLPDALSLLSNALKAGLSLSQSLDTVAHNAARPISDELARVVREMNLGSGAPQALGNMVRRCGSQDLDLVVTAIGIQMAVGGNLARLLDTISLTIRQRIQVKNQIAALTSQARASGLIITLLPFIVATLLYFVTPSYFRVMVDDPIGRILLVLAVFAIFIGNVFVRRIVNLRV